MTALGELREYLAERSHIGWVEEKRRQGFADHVYEPALLSEGVRMGRCTWMNCTQRPEAHHPDMLPYADLSESTKDYDRKTVDGVLAGIEAAGYQIVARKDRG